MRTPTSFTFFTFPAITLPAALFLMTTLSPFSTTEEPAPVASLTFRSSSFLSLVSETHVLLRTRLKR